jgi:hypothetical protein
MATAKIAKQAFPATKMQKKFVQQACSSQAHSDNSVRSAVQRLQSCCVCAAHGALATRRLSINGRGRFPLALIRAFRVAYVPNATSMPGLCCSYGCFSGLHYVMLLWFELCDCLCMPL